MNTVFKDLAQHKWAIAAVLFVALLAVVADVFVPYVVRDVIDGMTRGADRIELLWMFAAMAIACVGAQALRISQRILVERLASQLVPPLIGDGIAAVLGNTMIWHASRVPGEIYVRLERSANAIIGVLKIVLTDVAAPILGVAITLAIMFSANPFSGMAAAVVAFALCAVTIFQIVHQHGVRVEINRGRERLGGDAIESIKNVEAVKLYGTQAHEATRLRETSERLAGRELTHHYAMASFDMLKALIDYGGYAIVVGVAVLYPVPAQTAGTLVLVLLCYQRMMDPLRTIHRVVDEFAEKLTLARDYTSLGDFTPLSARMVDTPAPEDIDEANSHFAVQFHGVSFGYPKAATSVLSNVSFAVPHGAKVAIVGPSGAGKSTLGRLMTGLFVPTAGQVTTTGKCVIPIERQPTEQRSVAALSQDVLMVAGTVADNIRYGQPDLTDEEVRAAATAAGVHELLEDHSGGPRHVGERGDAVSVGQRQRIGLARVLTRLSSIVVLDEPTSSQDLERRKAFVEVVLKTLSTRTVFVITHDTDNLDWATHFCRVTPEGLIFEEKAQTQAQSGSPQRRYAEVMTLLPQRAPA